MNTITKEHRVMKTGRNHVDLLVMEEPCLEPDFPFLAISLKQQHPRIVPSTFAIKSLISVALYKVNNWLISMASDSPKPIIAAFFICPKDLLINGHRNPNGIKQMIFNMNSKLIPFTNGLKLIFG